MMILVQIVECFCEMQMLFVLVNGSEKSNARVLEYFGLGSRDLPRIGIYDGTLDEKWLMPSDEITTERVQTFCDSFLAGELQVRLKHFIRWKSLMLSTLYEHTGCLLSNRSRKRPKHQKTRLNYNRILHFLQ